MKHLFVPYELAVIAKEKGFSERCFGSWEERLGNIFLSMDKDEIDGWCEQKCVAPLYCQLVDWFREKHGIEIVIKPTISKHESSGSQKMFYSYELVSLETSKCFIGEVKETYYVALTEAMEQAFKPI